MLKIVGNTVIQEKHKATCHCGAVELELDQWHSRCTSLRLFYVQATWRYRCFCSLIWNPDSQGDGSYINSIPSPLNIIFAQTVGFTRTINAAQILSNTVITSVAWKA
jgi:hypothetical protein